jgi:hypothetical protein
MADLIIIKIFFFIFNSLFFILGKIIFLFFLFFFHFFFVLFREKIDFFFSYFITLLDYFLFKVINFHKLFINFYDLRKIYYFNFLENQKNIIIYSRAPFFVNNYYFFFSKNCSLWENYWYYKNSMYFKSNTSFYKLLSIFNNFLFNYNSKETLNFFFFNNFYKLIINDFFFYKPYTPSLNYGYFLDSEKLFLRFPRKSLRFNNLDFIISNNNLFSNFLFPKNSFKFSFYQNQIYSSGQIAYLNPFISKNTIDIWIYNYFKHLNVFFNYYMNNNESNLQNNKYNYFISQPQILHLLKLNYYEIQFILKLINEDPFFYNRNFLDVHWELYSNLINFNDYSKIDNFFIRENNFSFLKYLQFKIFNNKIGFNNPFELIYSSNYYTFKTNKRFTISEKDLCILPFHILLSSKNHLFNNDFFVNDILLKNRSNFFLNIFKNTGFFYSQKLFQYQQYFFFNKNNIANLLGQSYLKKISFQHFDPSIHNPWWESLSLSSKKKIILLLQNFSFSQIHLISLNLIDRYINGKFFYEHKDISFFLNSNQYFFEKHTILNNLKYLNILNYFENCLNFCLKNNGLILDYFCLIEFDFSKNTYKEYNLSSNFLNNQLKFNFFFSYSKKYFYEYFAYKNILFTFYLVSNIFYESNFFFIYDYSLIDSNLKEKNLFLYYFLDYQNFKNFVEAFFFYKKDNLFFFNEQYKNLLMYYFFSFLK